MSGDDATVVTVTDIGHDRRKVVSARKLEQLSCAREKAIQSRKLTQKATLEARLLDVRRWLGEFDEAKIERVQKALIDQAKDLQRSSKEVTERLVDILKDEATKRRDESASIKRSIERIKTDLVDLKSGRLATVGEGDQSTVVASVSSTPARARPVKNLSEISSIFSKDSSSDKR